jgi:hypothetical protein
MEGLTRQTTNRENSPMSTFIPATEAKSLTGSVDARTVSKKEMERLKAIDEITQTFLRLVRKTSLQVRCMIEVIHCKSPKHLILGAVRGLLCYDTDYWHLIDWRTWANTDRRRNKRTEFFEGRPSRLVLELPGHQVQRASDGGQTQTQETAVFCEDQQQQDPAQQQPDGQLNTREASESDPSQDRLMNNVWIMYIWWGHSLHV